MGLGKGKLWPSGCKGLTSPSGGPSGLPSPGSGAASPSLDSAGHWDEVPEVRGGEVASAAVKPPWTRGGRNKGKPGRLPGARTPRRDSAPQGLPCRRHQAAWQEPTRLPEPTAWLAPSLVLGGCPQTFSQRLSPGPQGTTPFPLSLVQPQEWILASIPTPVGPSNHSRPLEGPQLLP